MDEDKAWIDTNDLNNNNLRIDMVNRTARQGGGIALLHKVQYITARLETNLQLDSQAWSKANHSKKQKTHPSWNIPPTDRIINRQHTCKFLEDVSQLIQYLITNHTNLCPIR